MAETMDTQSLRSSRYYKRRSQRRHAPSTPLSVTSSMDGSEQYDKRMNSFSLGKVDSRLSSVRSYDSTIPETPMMSKRSLKDGVNSPSTPDTLASVDDYDEEHARGRVIDLKKSKSLGSRLRSLSPAESFSRSLSRNRSKQEKWGEESQYSEEESAAEKDSVKQPEPDRVSDFVSMVSSAFDYVDSAIQTSTKPIIDGVTEAVSEAVTDWQKSFKEPVREDSNVTGETRSHDDSYSDDESDYRRKKKSSRNRKSRRESAKRSESKSDEAKEQTEPPSKEPGVDRYKMVHVTVTALALHGLTVESKKKKKEENETPINAVISMAKNTTSSESFVYTHIPSLPVLPDPARASTGVKSKKEHLLAVWPGEHSHGDDEDGEFGGAIEVEEEGGPIFEPSNKQMGALVSSVAFSRLIGVSQPGSIENDEVAKQWYQILGPKMASEQLKLNQQQNYIPSMAELRVCLMRGSEMVPVGFGRIVISGEERDVEMTVPIMQEYRKNFKDLSKEKVNVDDTPSPISSEHFVLCEGNDRADSARFKGKKNETFKLEPDSFLRIRLQVNSVPQVRNNAYPSFNPGASKNYVPKGKEFGRLSKVLKKKYVAHQKAESQLKSLKSNGQKALTNGEADANNGTVASDESTCNSTLGGVNPHDPATQLILSKSNLNSNDQTNGNDASESTPMNLGNDNDNAVQLTPNAKQRGESPAPSTNTANGVHTFNPDIIAMADNATQLTPPMSNIASNARQTNPTECSPQSTSTVSEDSSYDFTTLGGVVNPHDAAAFELLNEGEVHSNKNNVSLVKQTSNLSNRSGETSNAFSNGENTLQANNLVAQSTVEGFCNNLGNDDSPDTCEVSDFAQTANCIENNFDEETHQVESVSETLTSNNHVKYQVQDEQDVTECIEVADDLGIIFDESFKASNDEKKEVDSMEEEASVNPFGVMLEIRRNSSVSNKPRKQGGEDTSVTNISKAADDSSEISGIQQVPSEIGNFETKQLVAEKDVNTDNFDIVSAMSFETGVSGTPDRDANVASFDESSEANDKMSTIEEDEDGIEMMDEEFLKFQENERIMQSKEELDAVLVGGSATVDDTNDAASTSEEAMEDSDQLDSSAGSCAVDDKSTVENPAQVEESGGDEVVVDEKSQMKSKSSKKMWAKKFKKAF